MSLCLPDRSKLPSRLSRCGTTGRLLWLRRCRVRRTSCGWRRGFRTGSAEKILKRFLGAHDHVSQLRRATFTKRLSILQRADLFDCRFTFMVNVLKVQVPLTHKRPIFFDDKVGLRWQVCRLIGRLVSNWTSITPTLDVVRLQPQRHIHIAS